MKGISFLLSLDFAGNASFGLSLAFHVMILIITFYYIFSFSIAKMEVFFNIVVD